MATPEAARGFGFDSVGMNRAFSKEVFMHSGKFRATYGDPDDLQVVRCAEIPEASFILVNETFVKDPMRAAYFSRAELNSPDTQQPVYRVSQKRSNEGAGASYVLSIPPVVSPREHLRGILSEAELLVVCSGLALQGINDFVASSKFVDPAQ
jgi:hypothetical protein